MKKLVYLSLGLGITFLLIACAQANSSEIVYSTPIAQNPTGSNVTITPEPTSTPSPTPTVTSTSLPTATATRATPTPTASPTAKILPTPTIEAGLPITLTTLNMVDNSVGWAVDASHRIVRTSDSGLTWTDVTPKNITPNSSNSFFLNAQSAWALDSGDPSKGLFHTTDGGYTWSMIAKTLPFPVFSTITFLNEKNGWAETYDVGAGNAYITLYGTQDSGVTWNQIMLSSPPDMQSDFPGALHLCNICSDNFYYDPERIIITYGDLASDPVNEVRLSVSMDLGKTWKDLHLPLPSSKFSDGLVAPQMPFFYSDKDGYLPFGIIKYNPDYTYAYDALAIYTTHDGGMSWKPSSTVLENVPNMVMSHRVLDFVSPRDAFTPCGNDLCVTHDGAQTWQRITTSLNFGYVEGKKYVEWFNFVSPTAGWAIESDGSTYSLFRTTDGGMSWIETVPQLIGTSP